MPKEAEVIITVSISRLPEWKRLIDEIGPSKHYDFPGDRLLALAAQSWKQRKRQLEKSAAATKQKNKGRKRRGRSTR